ncbi:hypothetical protein ABBQ38_003652 [Trebouxia sp. C0009 RCD-2024]
MQRQQLHLSSYQSHTNLSRTLVSRFCPVPTRCRSQPNRRLPCTPVAAAATDRPPYSSRLNGVSLLSHQNGVYTVGGSIETPVTQSKVYDMLIDYPNLNKVFSSIDECHTLTEKQALQLLQICRWEFLAFSGTFKTLLNVDEERDAGRVVFSLIKSSFMKDFEGQWQLTESPGGGCHVEHRLKVQPVLDAPPLFSGYAQRIFVKQVTKVLEDLLAALKAQE